MPMYPWRIQADLTKGETDPMVTVFVGPERAVMDAAGNPTSETYVEQSTSSPATVALSELSAALADPSRLTPQAAKPPR